MAKINIEFDTKEKSLIVTMDGKTVDNVVGISSFQAYSYEEKDEPKFSISIHKMEKDENEDLNTFTTISANEIIKGENLLLNHFMNKFGGK